MKTTAVFGTKKAALKEAAYALSLMNSGSVTLKVLTATVVEVTIDNGGVKA